MALVSIYKSNSTLPWFEQFFWTFVPAYSSFPLSRWGLAISILLATLSILFLGALYGITGLAFTVQPFVQMVGGFLQPGKPMANMYFVLFSYSAFPQ
jgi:OPT oligopeptide transporter protein